MKIKIGNLEFSEVWDGVLYKKLSDCNNILDWSEKVYSFIENL